MNTKTLLPRIETFLKRRKISAAAFGKQAMSDPAFVYQLRTGRRVWPETAKRVLGYMNKRTGRKRAA